LFKTGEDENHEPGRAVLSPRTSARYDD
jgi:hypothetical protein